MVRMLRWIVVGMCCGFGLITLVGCFQVDNPMQAGTGGTGRAQPTPHDVVIGGFNHAQGYCQPQANCAACHGTDLKGGANGEPSCLQCHGALWNTCGQNAVHDVNINGVMHAAGYCSPQQNCASCHGADLKGGANGEPSCFQCHGALWNTCGQNASHDVNLGGAMHASGYCSPYENCGRCHGDDLRGGVNGEPSCLQCHDQRKWMNCGKTQHNKIEDNVAHAQDWCKPQRDCAPCHGADLRGGPNGEPSCYRCHGDKWSGKECKGGGDDDDDAEDESLTTRASGRTGFPPARDWYHRYLLDTIHRF